MPSWSTPPGPRTRTAASATGLGAGPLRGNDVENSRGDSTVGQTDRSGRFGGSTMGRPGRPTRPSLRVIRRLEDQSPSSCRSGRRPARRRIAAAVGFVSRCDDLLDRPGAALAFSCSGCSTRWRAPPGPWPAPGSALRRSSADLVVHSHHWLPPRRGRSPPGRSPGPVCRRPGEWWSLGRRSRNPDGHGRRRRRCPRRGPPPSEAGRFPGFRGGERPRSGPAGQASQQPALRFGDRHHGRGHGPGSQGRSRSARQIPTSSTSTAAPTPPFRTSFPGRS